MLYSTLSILAQKVFFPNVKITPPRKWFEQLGALGELTPLSVPRDGKRVSAVHVSAGVPGGPKGVAILGHPISKKGKFFYAEGVRARIYLDHGFDVVPFDFNGFGESDRIDLRYWRDARATVRHMKEKHPGIPFVLHGTSFGAFHVMRAYHDLPPGSAVVSENMSRTVYDYWKRWRHTAAIVKWGEGLPVDAVREMEVIGQFQNWQRPDVQVLAIANGDDHFTPADEMMDAYSHLTRATKREVFLPGAKHLLGPYEQPKIYRDALSELLTNLLHQNRAHTEPPPAVREAC